MIHWIKRAMHNFVPSRRPVKARTGFRLSVETLEDRITPATMLGAPKLLDPIAAIRVDQNSYSLTGTLQEAAKNGATIKAYRDSNQNGVYNAGVDALVGSATVAKKGTTFAVTVPLQQNAANQFFIIATDGKLSSAPVKAPLITEDSIAPKVTGITRLSNTLTNAASVQYRVNFSEAVTGVDASDFQVIRTGSVAGGTVAVSGSGLSYTVTLSDLTGEGQLGLNLIDNDSIRDVLTNATQAHSLGGAGAGNGSYTKADRYTIDRIAPTVVSIVRAGEVIATTGSTVHFTVKFRESVTGVNAGDFALTSSGISGASISGVTGSGSTYTVTVNTGSGTGSVRLDLLDNDSIIDVAGNKLAGTGIGSGDFTSGQNVLVISANTDSLATVVLPALNLNLLGLQVQTSEIIISLSADAGNGKLLGNLLTTASHLIDLQEAADALNQVLSTTVGLLNSSNLGINLGGGSFDVRPVATVDVLTLHVAPVQLDLLGALVNTSPIDVSITASSGQGMILGNIVYDLSNLFNDLPGQPLNIDVLNQKLLTVAQRRSSFLGYQSGLGIEG